MVVALRISCSFTSRLEAANTPNITGTNQKLIQLYKWGKEIQWSQATK